MLAYSAFWLTEDAAFLRLVREKSAAGVPVRFMLGDPDSAAVAQRGADEGIGAAMGSKVRNALLNYAGLFGLPGIEFRLHGTTLYNSIYRTDDEMLVNAIAQVAPFDVSAKQVLLEAETLGGRADLLVQLMQFLRLSQSGVEVQPTLQ